MAKIDELIRYGKLVHEKGLVIGPGGNISIRDGNDMVIKKKMVDMSAADEDDYARFPLETADVVYPAELSSETPFHIACYRSGEDIGAIIHVHSPMMVAVSAMTDILESPSYEFDCILGKEVRVVDYIKPGSSDLAEAIAGMVSKGSNTMLLRRHGGISTGKDLEEAYLRIMALERACQTYLLGR